MREIHHVGITGGGIHEYGDVGKECGDNKESALVARGGGKQYPLMNDRLGGCGLIRILSYVNGAGVFRILTVGRIIMYFDHIAVDHTSCPDSRHAARSQINAFHTAPKGYLADRFTDEKLVGFICGHVFFERIVRRQSDWLPIILYHFTWRSFL